MYIALTFDIHEFTLGKILTATCDAICESPTRLTGRFCRVSTDYIEWNRSIVPNSIPVNGSFPTTHALCPDGI